MPRKIFKTLNPDIDITNKVVHHIDGNQSNNTFDNLVDLTRSEHYQLHLALGGSRYVLREGPKRLPALQRLESLINLYNEGLFIQF